MTEPSSITCSACGARVGEPCRSAAGQTYGPGHGIGQYHSARRGGRVRVAPNTSTAAWSTIGRIGALTSWANTVDRAARTRKARRAGPGSAEYWLARLDPAVFADATNEQRLAAAEASKRAYFNELARRSAITRSGRAKRHA